MNLTPKLTMLSAGMVAVTGCAATQTASQTSSTEETRKKPNIVILLSDDAGYADFGIHGSKTHLTPNIDKFASEGTRFSNGYVSAPVCSPSRAGLTTGRYQSRFGYYKNSPGDKKLGIPIKERGLPLTELTFADILKKDGYRTCHLGKWHLGYSDSRMPDKRGFDEYMMINGGHIIKGTPKLKTNMPEPENIPIPYRTDLIGDEACAFIERNENRPFCIYVAFFVPHAPLQARPDYLKEMLPKFKTKQRAVNACLTKSLDVNVGKILDKLKELGLEDDTLVFFLNDNGGAIPNNASCNAPLRGMKATLLEGGIRVPFAVRWPGKIPAGKVYNNPVISLDILPTAVAAAGGKLPDDRVYDGVNLLPYIDGSNKGIPHKTLYWDFLSAHAIRHGDWKMVVTPDDKTELFNLKDDLSESNDLAETNKEKLKELQELYEKWHKEQAKPLWDTSPVWKTRSAKLYHQDYLNTLIRN